MKKVLATILILVSCISYSQVFKIDTTEITHENKLRPCLSVVYDANSDFVKSAFKDYCKKQFSVKIKGYGFLSNADVVSAEDVMIITISDKRMNLYNRVIATAEGGSESKLFISFGYDFFVSKKDFPDAFANMNNLILNFSNKMLIDFYSDDIKDMNKKIKKINRDNNSNSRDIKKYSKRMTASKYTESERIEYSGKVDVATKQIEMNNIEINILQEKIVLYNVKLTTLTSNR